MKHDGSPDESLSTDGTLNKQSGLGYAARQRASAASTAWALLGSSSPDRGHGEHDPDLEIGAIRSLLSRKLARKRGLWADPNPIPPWDWRGERRGPGYGQSLHPKNRETNTQTFSKASPQYRSSMITIMIVMTAEPLLAAKA